jgi:ATP-dependent Clp protease ATP-binding subunit ClpC
VNGYNFTERVRRVLLASRLEAQRLHHEYVGTEHLLLGLVRETDGVAAATLSALGADPERVREQVELTVKLGDPQVPRGPDLPYTTRAKRVLELAMAEARELRHSYVGSEHLLLGILREERGIGAQVLHACGVTWEAARREVLALLGDTATHEPPPGSTSDRPRGEIRLTDGSGVETPRSVTVLLEFPGGNIEAHRFASLTGAIVFLRQRDKADAPPG